MWMEWSHKEGWTEKEVGLRCDLRQCLSQPMRNSEARYLFQVPPSKGRVPGFISLY